jgi:hypothetical protein
MGSEREQPSYGYNPFFNSMNPWQNYISKWFETNLGLYNNAIKVSEYWFKLFWEPWLKGARTGQKESIKVE